MDYPMMDACFMDRTRLFEEIGNNERLNNEALFVNMFIPQQKKVITFHYCYRTGKMIAQP